ncbi:hypothetical protein E2C01_059689 [Portunus trituberculatus]|uniref:Secreted protein n=1 Tax=Portunus trituberculatus TaxID=210409 RepID=A0A5B7H620_PORTR|nr:hypothetical protein [Portunus trituberculatus]
MGRVAVICGWFIQLALGLMTPDKPRAFSRATPAHKDTLVFTRRPPATHKPLPHTPTPIPPSPHSSLPANQHTPT